MASRYRTTLTTCVLSLTLTAGAGGGGSAPSAPQAPASLQETTPATPTVPLRLTVSASTGDATPRLQAALDTARQAGGGMITLTSGMFLISNTLRLPSNLTLVGSGRDTVVVMAPTMTTPGLVNDAYRSDHTPDVNITLRAFAIQGGRATPAGALTDYAQVWNPNLAFQAGQYMLQTRNLYLIYQARTDCRTAPTGFGPTQAANGIPDGSCVWDYVEPLWTPNTDPLILSRLNKGLVENLTVSQSRNNGMICEWCTEVTFEGNHLIDNSKNGIYLSNGEHVTVQHTLLSANYGGIALANAWYADVHDNVSDSAIVYFIGVGRDAEYCTITHNRGGRFLTNNESITGTAHGQTYPAPYGAYRYGLYNSRVADNVFTMLQLINSEGNVIQDNTLGPTGTALGGFALWLLGASNNLVLHNDLVNGESWGIVLQVLASNGTAQGPTPSVNNTLVGNTITDTRPSGNMLGIYVDAQSRGTVVHDNTVTLSFNKRLPRQRYTFLLDIDTEGNQ